MRRWSATVVALGFVLAACGGGAAPAGGKPLTKVHFSDVIRSVFYTPFYAALGKGFFRDVGLDVDMTTAQGSDKGAAALLAGTADISLLGPETAIYVQNQNSAVKLKIFAQLTGCDGSFLLGKEAVPGFTWESLRGKKILGWRPGSAPEMVLEEVLRRHGLVKGQDVEVVTNLAPPAIAGAFQSGQGDYVTEYEPVVSQFDQGGTGHVLASLCQSLGPYPETVFEATDKYVSSHADVLQRFTDAVYRGMIFTRTHKPEEVADAIAPYFNGTSKALLVQSVERYVKQDTWPKSPVADEAMWRTLETVMTHAGVLKPGQQVDFGTVNETRFAQQALKDVQQGS